MKELKYVNKMLYCQDMYARTEDTSKPLSPKKSKIANELKEECIEEIRQSDVLKAFPMLNMEKLEDIKIRSSQAIIRGNEVTFLYPETRIIAKYFTKYNMIILFPRAYSLPIKEVKKTIMHELMHALIDSEHIFKYPALDEGIAEYLTYLVCRENGEEYLFSYPHEALLILILDNITEGEIVNIVLNGELEEWIDSQTQEGCGEKFVKSLNMFWGDRVYMGMYEQIHTQIIQEVLGSLILKFQEEKAGTEKGERTIESLKMEYEYRLETYVQCSEEESEYFKKII